MARPSCLESVEGRELGEYALELGGVGARLQLRELLPEERVGRPRVSNRGATAFSPNLRPRDRVEANSALVGRLGADVKRVVAYAH